MLSPKSFPDPTGLSDPKVRGYHFKSSNLGFIGGTVCATLKSDGINPGSCDHWKDLIKPRLSLFRSRVGITVILQL